MRGGELASRVAGVLMACGAAAYILGQNSWPPAAMVLVGALAAWNVWEMLLAPAHQVIVHDDGTVELRSPVRHGSVRAADIVYAGNHVLDWRGKGALVLRTRRGTWRVHRKLDPGLFELLSELRRHNPGLAVES